MPLPIGYTDVALEFRGKGYRPDSYISFYLVRQRVDAHPAGYGGPAPTPGDYVIAIVYRADIPGLATEVYSSTAPVDLNAGTWSQFAIRYEAHDTNGKIQVYQNGAQIMDEQNIVTRDQEQPKDWNCVTFSSHGKYATQDAPSEGFPNNVWPEYSHLIDHLFLWDSAGNADGVQAYATSSLFIQGLAPDDDWSIENFRNSDGGATNLWDYVDDPGDPTPLEVSWCTASSVPPTSCSFTNIGPGAVNNGAHPWWKYLPGGTSPDAFGEFIGVNAVVACSQTGSVDYKGSSFMVDTQGASGLDFFGSSSIISQDQLLWSISPTDIHNPGTAWTTFEIQELKMGFKIEPE